MTQAQEHKSFSAAATKVIDADQGIVEHIVAVMGNIDRGDDVIHPGAFGKTIMERGLRVKVLDQHDTRSAESVIGKPLELREVGRLELPPTLTDEYPDATGALVAKTQFLLDTNRGREIFSRIKSGALDEYSIGYDPITSDYSTIEKDGKKKTVRNLRELRLWEYSPVIFGMNPGTQTLSAKEDEGKASLTDAVDIAPLEDKPWNVFEQDGEYCVYKVDEGTGKPVGDALGCHGSVDEAEAQMAALYANEPKQRGQGRGVGEEPVGDGGADVCVCPECGAEAPHEKGTPCAEQECPECGAAMEGKEAKAVMRTEADGQHPASHYLVVEDAEKPSTWHLRVRDVAGGLDHRLMGAAWAALHGGYRGNVYEGPGKREAIAKLTRLYASEDMDTPKAAEIPLEGRGILVIPEYLTKEQIAQLREELHAWLEGGDPIGILGTPKAKDVRYITLDDGDVRQGEEKVGRVLAARNARRLEAALATITEVLKDAGLISEPDEEETEEKQDQDAPAEKQAADGAPAEPEAGPDVPPTSERMALLQKLKMEMELLEVDKP